MKTAYINGTIYTMKAEGDTVEAFLVENGKFAYCGTNEEVLKLAGGCEVVDLNGAPVLPGMIDTHQHLYAYARDLLKLDLKKANSLKELLEMIRVRAEATPKGEWILGTGFDHEKFTDEKVLPTKEQLDEVCPDNPLIITRYCLHVNCANSLALKIGGVGPGFKPKVEGTVEFREDGEPTGVLRDAAAADITALVPDPLATMEGKKKALEAACYQLNANGLTGVHPIRGVHVNLPEYTDVYQNLADEGRLTVRVFLGFDELPGCAIRTGLGDEMVKYGFYKMYVDGNMGGRTALLTAPYEDDPTTCGVPNYTQEELNKKVKTAYELGLQQGAHVIGDKAAEMLTTAIEEALKDHPATDPRMFRMIHMSLLNPDVVERVSKLPVVIDIQPMFVSTNVHWSESRVGHERSAYHYCWRKLLDNGMILTAGSDSPCESFYPMHGVYAITTRKGMDGYPDGGWFPEERVTVWEAMCMYTRNAAYVSYEEDIKGTIEDGKLADFVIMDRDVFKTVPDEIKDIKVVKTFLGGKEVYSAQ
ncbi:MAG: amidohydrolase [Lachnospiraceae bacterium]|nr:amidohydrolase [Clostridia bacterium]MBQ6076284.1 amidohydrolase [Lachnospiraceae bacterium]